MAHREHGIGGMAITLQTPTGLGTLVITPGTLAAVGAVTLDRPIRWQHLSTYPDNPTNPNPTARPCMATENIGGLGRSSLGLERKACL